MTKEEADRLKPGDLIREVTTGKEVTLDKFTFTDFYGKTLLYVEQQTQPPSENVIWLPYFLEELELVFVGKKCTCDFYKVILTTGCKCGGS